MALPNVFFITGTSSGFGRELVIQLSGQGHKVIATARNLDKIEDFKELTNVFILQLDVASPEADIARVVQEAIAIHGYVTHVINNAGYGLFGCVEEPSLEQAKAQFDVNYWGALTVTREFLPHFRARVEGAKYIAAISSTCGIESLVATSYYCATKFAMEASFESLKLETQHLGIQVVLIEPGFFRTNILNEGTNIQAPKHVIADYKPVSDTAKKMYREQKGNQAGDPKLGCKRMIELLTNTGLAKEISDGVVPTRVGLGSDSYEVVVKKGQNLIDNCNKWAEFSKSTDYK